MGARGSILLADHDVMVRNHLRTSLQEYGYDVLVAADGGEALELARAQDDALDLLLTDVQIPILDGISLFRQISSERPKIKVLFLSGDTALPLELPRDLPFLRKPVGPDQLLAEVNQILGVPPPARNDLRVILVVDHDERRRQRTKDILVRENYAVLTAGSVEEAEAVSDSIAQIDLVISGVVFPGLSGVHLAEHVTASGREINTLLVSHFDRNLLRDVPGFQGQPEFLANPFTPEALLARVRRLLQ